MRLWFGKHKETSIASGLSLFLILLGWILAFLKLRHIKEPLILHYSTYTGINQIGGLRDVAAIGVTGVVLWLLDTALAVMLDDREPYFGRLTAFSVLVFGVLLFFAFIAIISLNS